MLCLCMQLARVHLLEIMDQGYIGRLFCRPVATQTPLIILVLTMQLA